MQRAITALLGIIVATWIMGAQADVKVLAVRLGASDVVALPEFLVQNRESGTGADRLPHP